MSTVAPLNFIRPRWSLFGSGGDCQFSIDRDVSKKKAKSEETVKWRGGKNRNNKTRGGVRIS
jgi:hypothetical protein